MSDGACASTPKRFRQRREMLEQQLHLQSSLRRTPLSVSPQVPLSALPTGRLVVLEFSLPCNALCRWAYLFYFNHILPRTATLIARDRSGAYRYLPRSVNTFLSREQLVGMMQTAGFVNIAARPLTFGIAVAYVGEKPR